jgi:hypothetical protein
LLASIAAPSTAVPTPSCHPETAPLAIEDGVAVTVNAGAPGLLSLDVPAPGWLLVEVESPGSGDAVPWLDVAEPGCGSGGGYFVDRGLDHGLLAVEPGVLRLRLGTVSPGTEPELRLVALFVPHGDPDVSDKDGEEGDDTEAGDGEIVPSALGEGDDRWWDCVHGREPFNDFGICAAELQPDRRQRRSLGEAVRLDRDYFTFELERRALVRLSARGSVAVRGTLSLENGRPLAAGGGEERTAFEIVAELVPGRYLVRVEAAGEAVGEYRISLRTEPLTHAP